MSKPTIVHLRIYKGTSFSYKEDKTTIANENQTIKLRHDTKEWHNFIDNMYRNGWGRANVMSAKQESERKGNMPIYKDVDTGIFDGVQAEIDTKLKPQKTITLTPDQKELKALKAEMAELKGLLKGDKTPDTNEELEAARKEWKELTGSDAHHMKQLKGLNADIAKYKEDNK